MEWKTLRYTSQLYYIKCFIKINHKIEKTLNKAYSPLIQNVGAQLTAKFGVLAGWMLTSVNLNKGT